MFPFVISSQLFISDSIRLDVINELIFCFICDYECQFCVNRAFDRQSDRSRNVVMKQILKTFSLSLQTL